MSLRFISDRTRVEVKSEINDFPYITTVNSVMEERQCVLLDIMRLGGEEVRLTVGKPYKMRFFTDRGVFSYSGVMRGYVKKDNYDFMLVQTTGEAVKTQRRQSFRLACGEKIDFNMLDGDITMPHWGLIRDISSGGIRLLTVSEINETHLAQLQLPMIDPNFWVYGTVLSKHSLNNDEAKYNWQHGIEFVGLTDAETEKIIKFVHAEQHKARAAR
ncbi:MAG: PilZ domain-containing protein [Defluviitaleaceae bacterium]|nr:PilZ domain-containing protein [Defluviitaleaceae bacterium]